MDIYKHEHKPVLIERNKEVERSKPQKFCCDEMKKAWNKSVITHHNGYGRPPQIWGHTMLWNIYNCPFCGEKIDYDK